LIKKDRTVRKSGTKPPFLGVRRPEGGRLRKGKNGKRQMAKGKSEEQDAPWGVWKADGRWLEAEGFSKTKPPI